jgi:hypothetical protein
MCTPDLHLHAQIHTARKLSPFNVAELFACFSMCLFVYLFLVHVRAHPLTNAVILWLFVCTFVDVFPKL